MTEKNIELDNNRRLVVTNDGDTYVCTLVKIVGDKAEPLTGSDNKWSIVITGEIDSPSNFQKIAQWLGNNQAVTLMIGLGNMK